MTEEESQLQIKKMDRKNVMFSCLTLTLDLSFLHYGNNDVWALKDYKSCP